VEYSYNGAVRMDMQLTNGGVAPDRTDFLEALDNLRDLAALMDADGLVLFANKALIGAQGCSKAGAACRNIGLRPCPQCLMADGAVLAGSPYVTARGRIYERSVSPFGGEEAPKFTILWVDVTASAESTRLLKKQYDKMRRDIFHARSIQFSLLPKELAKAEGYTFRSLYKPSEEMSGDIFDLIRIGRDNMAFYVADVSGHGVTAAMLTIFFNMAVRLEMRPTDMPGRVLAKIHSRFMELQLEEQHYITAFLGRLELSTGKLYWSNAGHICPPVLLDASGAMTTLEMAGLPISRWFKNQEYATSTGQMEQGGKLVLYSDGLEAQWQRSNAAGELDETVGGIMAKTAPEDCLEEIWRTVGEGTDENWNRDDTTLLLINRLRDGGNEVKG
jgi:phosphoserine phosphatase RsbU/P